MTTRIKITNDSKSDKPEEHRVRVVRGFSDSGVLSTDLDITLNEGETTEVVVWAGIEVRVSEA